jgi:hypothetical protein
MSFRRDSMAARKANRPMRPKPLIPTRTAIGILLWND